MQGGVGRAGEKLALTRFGCWWVNLRSKRWKSQARMMLVIALDAEIRQSWILKSIQCTAPDALYAFMIQIWIQSSW